MVFKNTDEEYIVLLKSINNKDRFIDKLSVTANSYSGKIASDIWDSLFIRSIDLKRDYLTYFQDEYATFSSYLELNHELSVKFLNQSDKLIAQYDHIYLFSIYHTFLREDEGLARLRMLLRVGNRI